MGSLNFTFSSHPTLERNELMVSGSNASYSKNLLLLPTWLGLSSTPFTVAKVVEPSGGKVSCKNQITPHMKF